MSEGGISLEEVLTVAEQAAQYTYCKSPRCIVRQNNTCDYTGNAQVLEALALLNSDTDAYKALHYHG